jgi:hypothetical protein
MDSVGGPDAKKARWSPSSFTSNAANGLPAAPNASARDPFANYGYGPQASISQAAFANSTPGAGFGASQLYSTPSLSINTSMNANGMAGQQMSPNTAAAFLQGQQQQGQQLQTPISANGNNPYANLGAYNMLGMGMPGMNMMGFPYGAQLGNFGQVRSITPSFPFARL